MKKKKDKFTMEILREVYHSDKQWRDLTKEEHEKYKEAIKLMFDYIEISKLNAYQRLVERDLYSQTFIVIYRNWPW